MHHNSHIFSKHNATKVASRFCLSTKCSAWLWDFPFMNYLKTPFCLWIQISKEHLIVFMSRDGLPPSPEHTPAPYDSCGSPLISLVYLPTGISHSAVYMKLLEGSPGTVPHPCNTCLTFKTVSHKLTEVCFRATSWTRKILSFSKDYGSRTAWTKKSWWDPSKQTSKQKLGMMVHACYPSISRKNSRLRLVWAKTWGLVSKITKAKWLREWLKW
jgi:hypothetical protein